METLNKTKKFLLLISILIIVWGVYHYLWPRINIFILLNKKDTPIYSVNEKDIEGVKRELVPSDFPFPEDVKSSDEFKRTINSLDEYTNVWEAGNSFEKTKNLYVKYMIDNGWNPFVSNMSETLVSISGEKGGVVLNIFIEKISNSLTKVQVHFSQKK